MDTNIIKPFFLAGKIFVLIPTSFGNKKAIFYEKVFVVFLFCLCILGTCTPMYYRRSQYLKLNPIQLALWLSADLNRCCQSYYSLIVLVVWKRHKWFKLMRNLNNVNMYSKRDKIFDSCLFVLSHIGICCLLSSMVYFCFSRFGYNCLMLYQAEHYQFYSQFFYMLLSCVVLRLLLARYRSQTLLLIDTGFQKNVSLYNTTFKNLQQIKNNIVILKEMVDMFNDIFGGAILLNILYISSKSLIYLDNMVKKDTAFKSSRRDGNVFLYFIQGGIMTTFWVSF